MMKLFKKKEHYRITDEPQYVVNERYASCDFCTYANCPICGELVDGGSIGSANIYTEVCPKCGQKLMWRHR